MKKIVMAVTNTYTYDARVRREAETLAENNFDVHVVCIHKKGFSAIEVINNVTVHRITPAPWNGTFGESLTNIYRYMRYIFKYGTLTQKYIFDKLVQLKGDIYHSHDFNTLLPISQAAKLMNVRFVYDSHELFIETLKDIPQKNMIEVLFMKVVRLYCYVMEKKYIRQARATITVNEPIAELLKKKYNINAPMVLLNVPQMKVQITPYNWRKKYGIHNYEKIILYQGMINASRGVFSLIKSLKHLKNTHLIFLGYGPQLQQAKNMVSALNLDNVIHFHDTVSQKILLEYTSGADLGIALIKPTNLSQKFALPNKLFEYMMAGIPVLCSDLPVMKKIVETEKNGLLVSNLDPKEIAKAIMNILNSTSYNEMKQNSLKASHARYNWNKESAKLISLYNTII